MPSEGPPGFSGVPVSAMANHCWYIFSFTATANSMPLMAESAREGRGSLRYRRQDQRSDLAKRLQCSALCRRHVVSRSRPGGQLLLPAGLDTRGGQPEQVCRLSSWPLRQARQEAGPRHLGHSVRTRPSAAPRRAAVRRVPKEKRPSCANAQPRLRLAALRCPSTSGAPDAAT